MMDDGFLKWLAEEMNTRRWKPGDLAREADLSQSMISYVLSEQRNPGPDFCLGIAKAFAVPPELVFRRAGLLPALPGSADRISEDVTLVDLVDLMRRLTPGERREVYEYAAWRYKRQSHIDEANEESHPASASDDAKS